MSDKEILLQQTKELLNYADEKTVRMVHAILTVDDNSDTDWWDEMDPIQKKRLETSIAQADNGELYPHSEAENILLKWQQ